MASRQLQSLHSSSSFKELKIAGGGKVPKVKLENETLYAKIKFQDMDTSDCVRPPNMILLNQQQQIAQNKINNGNILNKSLDDYE